jgi:hypothetical protein
MTVNKLENLNKLYRQEQINPLLEQGEFMPKIQIRNPNNNKKTFWLNITFDELDQIINILNK